MKRPPLWKAALDLTKDQINAARQTVDRGDGGPPFADRYLRRDQTCVVDLLLDTGAFQDGPQHLRIECDFVGRVTEGEGVMALPVEVLSGERDARSGLSGYREPTGYQEDGRRDPVFVVVGEVSEQGEFVDIRATPPIGAAILSVVRLVRLDEVGPVVGPKVVTDLPLGKEPGVVVHWELDASSPTQRREATPPDTRELPEGVIQRAAQVMDNVTNAQTEQKADVLKFGDGLDPKDVVAGLRVSLGTEDHSVGLVLKGALNVVLKGVAVKFRPRQLPPRTSERRSVGHVS